MCKCIASDGVGPSPAKQASAVPNIHVVLRLLTTYPAGNEGGMELSLSAFEGRRPGKFPALCGRPCISLGSRRRARTEHVQPGPCGGDRRCLQAHRISSAVSHIHGRITSGGAFSVNDGKETASANDDRTGQARRQKFEVELVRRWTAPGRAPDVHAVEMSPREWQGARPLANDR